MKKSLKIAGISLATLLGVVLIVASVAVYVVFTPERLTPIVKKVLPEIVTCESDLRKVELTFFSTFPQFGLELDDVCLINPMQGANDTLAFVDELVATVDVWAFLTENKVQLNSFYLKNVTANVFVDSCGKANYDIFPPSESVEDTSAFVNPFDLIAIDAVEIENLYATYNDLQNGVMASVGQFSCSLDAQLSAQFDGKANLQTSIQTISAKLVGENLILADISNLKLDVDAEKTVDIVDGKVILSLPDVSFKMGESVFLDKRNICLEIPLSASLDSLKVSLQKAKLELENHEIILSGNAKYCENTDIAMNVDFATNKWVISEVLSLVPAEYASLLDGVEVDGDLLLQGNVDGVYNDSTFPKISAQLLLENGKGCYEGIPYRLRDIFADLSADVDLNEGALSSAKIKKLSAKTGTSTLQASGVVNDLLGNLHCDLQLKGDVNLPELKPLLADMNVQLQGRAKANLNARFALDDVINLNLKKICASGNIALSNLDVVYEDSMFVKSPDLSLAFGLPSKRENKLAEELIEAKISSSAIDFVMTETLSAKIAAANLDLGISNILDTTVIPTLACNFDMQHLSAEMDTIMADVEKPSGKVAFSPSPRNKKNPHLELEYSSESLAAAMGQFLDVKTKYIKMVASTTYNEKQDNAYLKWNPTFGIDFNDGVVQMVSLSHKVQIPSIKFNLTPRDLYIGDSRIIIADSDFKLSGHATNIRKFINKKGDLIGTFDFVSDKTNVNQLLDLVNGFGVEEVSSETTAEVVEKEEATKEDNPFMVPKGVDLTLNTKIKKAIFGDILAENLGGKLMVKNGVAILEQMGFTCDAANMQLTAIEKIIFLQGLIFIC